MGKKTWLITGGAGFIGSTIAKHLCSLGQNVIIYDNFSSKNKIKLPKTCKIIKADICDADTLNATCSGVDYILHLAAVVSVPKSFENPLKTELVNVKGTLNVLEAAKKNKVKKVILSSTCAVYGTSEKAHKESDKISSLSPYAGTKAMAENLCKMFTKAYRVDTVILRYFNVYGPKQSFAEGAVIPRFIEDIKRGKPLTIYGDGLQTRNFVYVDDVIKANILAIKKGMRGHIYNVASGKSVTLLDLVKNIAEVWGKKPKIIFKPTRQGDVKKSSANITKIKNIGFRPTITLKHGLTLIKNDADGN